MLRVLTGVAGAGLSFLAGGLAKERLDQQRENTALLTAFRENVYIKSLSVSAEEQQKQRERSFIMIKPDGVQRGLVGEIIKRFEQKGFKLVAIRMMRPGLDHLKAHYADLSARPFFPGLVSYMDSGPVVAMCWEGDGVVKTGRLMLGETNPRDSKPGTIRGDYCIQVRQTQTGNIHSLIFIYRLDATFVTAPTLWMLQITRSDSGLERKISAPGNRPPTPGSLREIKLIENLIDFINAAHLCKLQTLIMIQ